MKRIKAIAKQVAIGGAETAVKRFFMSQAERLYAPFHRQYEGNPYFKVGSDGSLSVNPQDSLKTQNRK